MVLPGYLWRIGVAALGGSALGLAFRILFALTMGLGAWAFHTWMVVVLNEGTHPGDPWLAQFLALGTWMATAHSSMLWTVAAWVMATLVRRFFQGPLRLAGALFGFPGWVVGTARQANTVGALAAALGVGIGALLGVWIGTRPLLLLLAIAGFISLSARERAIPLGLARAAAADVRTLSGRPGMPDVGPAALALCGLLGGLLHAGLTPGALAACSGISVILAGIGTFVALRVRGGASLVFLLLALPALGDDGGWREAGGTLPGWLTSPGAIPAVLVGLLPGAGTFIGIWVGLLPPPDLVLDEDADPATGEAGDSEGDADADPDEDGDLSEVDDGPEGDLGWEWDDWPEPDDCVWAGWPDDWPGLDVEEGGAGCGSAYGLPRYALNLATLDLHVRDVMYAAPGPGPDLLLALTWSKAMPARGLGPGWRFEWDEAIVPHGAEYAVWLGSGRVVVLAAGETERWKLTRNGDTIELMDRADRSVRVFREVDGRFLLGERRCAVGQVVRVERAHDRVVAVTDAVGRRFVVERGEWGQIVALRLPDGRAARFAYAKGRLAETWDLADVHVRYHYDGPRLVRMDVGGRPRSWAFRWNGDQISAITDPDGAVEQYRSQVPQDVVRTDPEGETWRVVHEDGRVVLRVDPLGQETRQEWVDGRRVALHLPGGRTWRFEYGETGAVAAVTDPDGHVHRCTWDADAHLVGETLPDGGHWRTEWQGERPVRTIDPTGATTELRWDDRGALVGLTRPDGTTLAIERDRFGNAVRLTDGTGREQRYEYDPHGLSALAHIDRRGHRTEMARDGNDRITRVGYADGSATEVDWGCCAPVSVLRPDGTRVRFERDGNLRLVAWGQGPSGLTASRDACGRVTGLTDALGRTLTTEYDAAGQPLSMGLGSETERLTWHAGKASAVVDAKGHRTRLERDGRGRVTAETDALGRRTSWSLDAGGRPSSQVDGRGRRLDWTHDGAGRLVARSVDGQPDRTWVRDDAGRLVTARSGAGDVTFTWSERGALEQISYVDGQQAGFSWDEEGGLVGVRCPGVELVMERDPRGRVSALHFAGQTVRYARDAMGRVCRVERSNGTVSEATWSEVGQVVRLVHRTGDKAFVDLTLDRDAAGRVVRRHGEVPRVAPAEVARPPVELDAADQLLKQGEVQFDYDLAGNRVSGTDGWSADYDAEGLLVRAVEDRFTYDALGQRVRVERPGVVRHQHRDPWGRLLFETDGTGALTTTWVWDDDALVARVDASGEVAFYHCDEMGHVLARTDSSGMVRASFAYSVFGLAEGDPDDDPFGWCGAWGVEDDGGGRYRMGRRHYDAGTGRFLQRDPYGPDAGLDRYHYAGGNPANAVDPLGLFVPLPVAIGLGLALVGAIAAAARAGRELAAGPVYGTLPIVGEGAGAKPPADIRRELEEHIGPDPRRAVLEDQMKIPAVVVDGTIGQTPFGVGWQIGKIGKHVGDGNIEGAITDTVKLVPGVSETPIGWGLELDGIDKNLPEFGFCRAPIKKGTK